LRDAEGIIEVSDGGGATRTRCLHAGVCKWLRAYVKQPCAAPTLAVGGATENLRSLLKRKSKLNLMFKWGYKL